MELSAEKRTDLDDWPVILSAHEVSKMMRVSIRTVLQMARDGELPAKKVGREWRFSRRALIEYLEDGNQA